ncbi:MAG TPA: SRPBCC domain-containing protein [Nitrososphaeraceae archaeon]|nr:SRPBCC domain-containing protein [Nitrososphaeraceae archaeon]
MKELTTEIQINSSPEILWKVITDFKNYYQWNPILQKIKGEPLIGKQLEIHLITVGGKKRVYHPKVIKITPNHELRWKGTFFFSQIFSGERIFLIEKLSENKVNFVNKEIFSGIGVRFTSPKMEDEIVASFKKMNEALKKTIERS